MIYVKTNPNAMDTNIKTTKKNKDHSKEMTREIGRRRGRGETGKRKGEGEETEKEREEEEEGEEKENK